MAVRRARAVGRNRGAIWCYINQAAYVPPSVPGCCTCSLQRATCYAGDAVGVHNDTNDWDKLAPVALHPPPHSLVEVCVAMDGFLVKKGGGTSLGGRTNWKKRWFALRSVVADTFLQPLTIRPQPRQGDHAVLLP